MPPCECETRANTILRIGVGIHLARARNNSHRVFASWKMHALHACRCVHTLTHEWVTCTFIINCWQLLSAVEMIVVIVGPLAYVCVCDAKVSLRTAFLLELHGVVVN